MKALILAGGLGTRLRPLTYTRPKHLLPIANRPHIEHVLDLLVAHDVRDVVLLTSYLAEEFAPTVDAARARGMRVEVTHEDEPLGTAGALKNAEPLVADGTFLAFNGDILTDVDLGEVVRFHRERRAVTTILLTPVEDPFAFGVVPTEDDGRVTRFIEKPPPGTAPTNLINAGVYVFEPAVLDHIPSGEVWSAERALFPGLVEDGEPVFALGTDAYWLDIGTPEKYLQGNLDALAGRYVTSAVPAPGPKASLVADGATVAPDARVSSSCIGTGAIVESGAVVERSVLLPGASIGSGAVVRGSTIGEGARVAPESEISNSAVADGSEVGTEREEA
ncbi:MAG TPA: NDP-sugar synthase [Actinomycetota bacterium]|jgi:mannose-1-phosphate guanylyltransferase